MPACPLKIDLHTHILPESWPDLSERYGQGSWPRLEHTSPGCARVMIDDRLFREVEPSTWDPTVRLADCDRCGVDVQVLSTVPVMFSYSAKVADALDLSRLLNDHLAGVCADRPTRFVGLGTIPMQDPDVAVKELQRCVEELGLVGVQIGSHVNGANLDDPALFGVFEAAAALNAAVFVHPWEMLGGQRMTKYWLPWLVGMPAETALAICSVIFGGVLERLPALRIAFAHGGGAFAFTLGRIDYGFKVRPDLCAVDCSLSPRGQLGRFYVDSLVHDAAALKYLIEVMGTERVALGSDYPFALGEKEPGALIETLDGLSTTARARLLGGSALEFLGLTADAFVGTDDSAATTTARPPAGGSPTGSPTMGP